MTKNGEDVSGTNAALFVACALQIEFKERRGSYARQGPDGQWVDAFPPVNQWIVLDHEGKKIRARWLKN